MSRARDIANLQSSKITADAGIDIANITLESNDISTTNANGNLTITPNGTGDLQVNSDRIKVRATEGESATLVLAADEDDDGGDTWKIVSNTDNTFAIQNDISDAADVTHFSITPHATVTSSTVVVAGKVGIGGVTPSSYALDIKAPANTHPLRIGLTSDDYGYTTFQNSSGDVGYIGLGGGAAIGNGNASTLAIRGQQELRFATGGNNEVLLLDTSQNATFAGDVSLAHDAAVLSFGADSEVTLTHEHNQGLKLDSSYLLYFNGTNNYIHGVSANELTLNGGTDGISFDTGGVQKMALTNSGDLQIGTGNSHAPVIQGTTNDGRTSGSPGYSFNGDLDTGMYQGSGLANTISFSTAGSERIRIDATGMTGIGGNTDPNFLLHINKGSTGYSPTGVQTTFLGINTANDATNSQGLYVSHLSGNWINGITDTSGTSNTSWGVLWNYQNSVRGGIAYDHYGVERMSIWSAYGHICFSTYDTVSTHGFANSSGMTERLMILTGGEVLFGCTSTSAPSYYFAPDSGGGSFKSIKDSTNSRTHFEFHNTNGTIGTITTSGSATAYNTSSDYRLKENVSYDWDATSRLKQLKPARFNWKADQDNTVDGFLAHEVSSIVPEAINGEKDAMRDEQYEIEEAVKDDEGKITKEAVMGTRTVPSYQSIDQSKLVPLLVKTIQELEARIAKLEGS